MFDKDFGTSIAGMRPENRPHDSRTADLAAPTRPGGGAHPVNSQVDRTMARILNSFVADLRREAAPKAPQCECDYDAEGDPLEYVKTSRCCPVHDDCDCCGEVKGTKKDRTLTVAGRPAWVCDECYLLCDDHGEKDCEVCAERAKQPEVRYI